MKKIIALLLVALIAFSLAACSMGKDKGNATNPPANTNSANNANNADGTNNTNGANNNSENNNNNNNTRNTENMLESMIPDVSTNVSTEGQR